METEIPKEHLELDYLIRTSHSVMVEFGKNKSWSDDDIAKTILAQDIRITELFDNGDPVAAYNLVKTKVMASNLQSGIGEPEY